MATYIWQKYTVTTSTVYEDNKSPMKFNRNQDVTKKIRYASKYTFNTSTGVYTLTSSVSGTIADLTSTKKYYMFDSSTSGSQMYEFRSLSTIENNEAALTYYLRTSASSEAETKGTYISDVTSENASAYPTNGKHTDGYWYVYVGSKSPPGIPGTPSFSNPENGKALSVSWSAASDADGNLSGYILEVQLNGGSWTQVYKGSARTYSYTVPDSTETIAFRVKAYDTDGAESSYATSATEEVLSIGGISGELNINGVVYELTGEGYVNIKGVLCEIVDSYGDIDGVLKSLSGGTDRVKLPDGYTQVEYIQSSGTQYINTAFTADSGTKVVMDCELTYPSEWVMVMGSYDSGAYFSWWSKDSVIYAYYGSSNQSMTGSSGRATLDADKNVWSAGGSSLTFGASSFVASSPLYLFSISNGGNYALGIMKLYSCQIYDNGTLIRDFVPCTNASGAAGLYDTVNGVFYGNSGTGAFTTG